MIDDFKHLPKRGHSDHSFENYSFAGACSFISNYYPVTMRQNMERFYQYDVTIKDVPDDSDLYDKAMKSLKSQFAKEIGYVFSKRRMIWGTKDTKMILNFPFEEDL